MSPVPLPSLEVAVWNHGGVPCQELRADWSRESWWRERTVRGRLDGPEASALQGLDQPQQPLSHA